MTIPNNIAMLGSGITGTAVLQKLEELGGFNIVQPEDAELVIASPGIHPNDFPKINAEIISEIEFAYRLMQSGKYGAPPTIVSISGTNGKTTTTTLIGLILDCPVAGNIGKPLIAFVGEAHKYISCEVSSYQLETSLTFKPHVAILLNLTEDHLTRHITMENYCAAKAIMVLNQGADDYFVYNANDRWLTGIAEKAQSHKVPFTSKTTLGQNQAAVIKTAEILKVPPAKVEKVFAGFKGVEHRLEQVGVFNGIKAINDSKGTNPDSTIVALESSPNRVILIAGGRDKLTSLTEMCKFVKAKTKIIILLGEATARFEEAFLAEGIPQSTIFKTACVELPL